MTIWKSGEPMKQLPIIASVVREDQLPRLEKSNVKTVILMTGNILNIKGIIEQLHRADKTVYVHIEMVEGIGRDTAAIEYLGRVLHADGIVSTKSNMIHAAHQIKLQTIQRVFAIDTGAFETAVKMINSSKPGKVELMPGLMPRVIRDMKQKIRQPLIVGGLIKSLDEIETALQSGADYVSIGDECFW
jgi:glycerol uptake operon antiterminator